MWDLVFIGGEMHGEHSRTSLAAPPKRVWWLLTGTSSLPKRIWERYDTDPEVEGQLEYQLDVVEGDEAFYVAV